MSDFAALALGAVHPCNPGFVGRADIRVDGGRACPRAKPVKLVATLDAASHTSCLIAWSARYVALFAVHHDCWPNVVDIGVQQVANEGWEWRVLVDDQEQVFVVIGHLLVLVLHPNLEGCEVKIRAHGRNPPRQIRRCLGSRAEWR